MVVQSYILLNVATMFFMFIAVYIFRLAHRANRKIYTAINIKNIAPHEFLCSHVLFTHQLVYTCLFAWFLMFIAQLYFQEAEHALRHCLL